jgi:branched-chain amino acid transport system permease protein
LFALAIGAICLRTRGVYFIMITLAFAQMLYFLVFSLEIYGGDDGMSVRRSLLLAGVGLRSDTVMYYSALMLLSLALYLLWRIVHSRFGQVLRSIKENESRMAGLGYPVYRYQLVAFVIGGGLAGLAGVLSANLNGYASPNLLAWQQSGHLMMMVILGGVGNFWGGVIGAVVLLLLEEWLSGLTIHWQFGVGAILLLVVLFAPKGIAGWFGRAL